MRGKSWSNRSHVATSIRGPHTHYLCYLPRISANIQLAPGGKGVRKFLLGMHSTSTSSRPRHQSESCSVPPRPLKACPGLRPEEVLIPRDDSSRRIHYKTFDRSALTDDFANEGTFYRAPRGHESHKPPRDSAFPMKLYSPIAFDWEHG